MGRKSGILMPRSTEIRVRAMDLPEVKAALEGCDAFNNAAVDLIERFRTAAENAQGHHGIEECSGVGEPDTEWDEIQYTLAGLAAEAREFLDPLGGGPE